MKLELWKKGSPHPLGTESGIPTRIRVQIPRVCAGAAKDPVSVQSQTGTVANTPARTNSQPCRVRRPLAGTEQLSKAKRLGECRRCSAASRSAWSTRRPQVGARVSRAPVLPRGRTPRAPGRAAVELADEYTSTHRACEPDPGGSWRRSCARRRAAADGVVV